MKERISRSLIFPNSNKKNRRVNKRMAEIDKTIGINREKDRRKR